MLLPTISYIHIPAPTERQIKGFYMNKFLSNLNVAKKLQMSYFVFLLILFVIVTLSIFVLSKQKSIIENDMQTRLNSYQISMEIISKIRDIHLNVYKIISWTSTNFAKDRIESLSKDQNTSADAVVDLLKKYIEKSNFSEGEEKKSFDECYGNLVEYKKVLINTLEMISSDISIASMYLQTADEKYEILDSGLQKLFNFEKNNMQEEYDSSIAIFRLMLAVSVIAGVLALAGFFTNISFCKKNNHGQAK